MPTCRVIKNANFTTISNYHLRDKSLSMKAKGLLTIMLSLPEEWDYTIKGLAALSADGRDSISNTIRELEEHGYIKRHQSRDEKGTFAQNEYWIYEMPQTETGENKYESISASVKAPVADEIAVSYTENENTDEDEVEDVYETDEDMIESDNEFDRYNPVENRPFSYNPLTDYPMTAKTAQLNTKELNTKTTKIRYDLMRARAEQRVEYAILRDEFPTEQLDELIALIVEMESCQSESMLIAGAVYPREVVISRMQMLNAECVRYVVDCLREVKPKIRNMKKYLMAALFNAPATIENFVDTRVRHDVYGTTAIKSGRAV